MQVPAIISRHRRNLTATYQTREAIAVLNSQQQGFPLFTKPQGWRFVFGLSRKHMTDLRTAQAFAYNYHESSSTFIICSHHLAPCTLLRLRMSTPSGKIYVRVWKMGCFIRRLFAFSFPRSFGNKKIDCIYCAWLYIRKSLFVSAIKKMINTSLSFIIILDSTRALAKKVNGITTTDKDYNNVIAHYNQNLKQP